MSVAMMMLNVFLPVFPYSYVCHDDTLRTYCTSSMSSLELRLETFYLTPMQFRRHDDVEKSLL